jgi:broad specificity phosphatase PhoE
LKVIQSNLLKYRRVLLAGAVIAWLAGPAAVAAPVPLTELAKPGRVLILRHALAPGVGDPANFRLGDCSTQRNLDATGRKQAVALGQRLAQAGIGSARVFSSQWCRTLETARLLALGPVTELPPLNSFFELAENRDSNITALRRFLAKLPADGPLVVLVTHQVTISAITGVYASSGGGVILQVDGSAAPRAIGEISAN